jgi:hypothetical protein
MFRRTIVIAWILAVCCGCSGESPQEEVMKIRLERSGGFAGMTRTVEVDVDSLSEDERSAVMGLVQSADFFALPASVSSDAPAGADRFNYRITVESAHGTHTVEATEASAPDSLEPLIDWLNRNGQPP